MTTTTTPPVGAYSVRGLPFATTRAAQAIDRAAGHIRTYRHGLPDRQEQARHAAIAALTDVIVAAAAAKDTLERDGAIPVTKPGTWPAAAPEEPVFVEPQWPAAVTAYDDGSVLIATPYVPVQPAPQVDPALRDRGWPAAGSVDAARGRNRGAQP